MRSLSHVDNGAVFVQHFLESSARRWPDKVALVCGARRSTYRQIDLYANAFAHALRNAGVQRGDRVTILLENSIEAVVAIFGALKADAVFMVIHAGTKRGKLAALLADAEPAALVSDRPRLAGCMDAVLSTPSLRCVVWADDQPLPLPSSSPVRSLAWNQIRRHPAESPIRKGIDLDLATLIYTSGSTGQAKGVMSTHANIVAAATSINRYLGNTSDDVILDVLPLAFDYGLYQVLLAFQVGARVVLETGFAFPARTTQLMRQEGVTALPGVPTLFALLLKYPALLQRPFPRLRYITNTGAALPVNHIEALRAAFSDVRIFSMYGLTECKRVSYLPPEYLDERPTSVGVSIPNTEVYVVAEDGRRLPPGEVGELVIRGSHVTRGYWRAPELTAARFRPGPMPGETVLYSGDLFRMDEDGFLYFIARKDDVIKSRGEKVGPREVENAVCQLDGVAEAAVTGVPDPILGEAVYLTVVPRYGMSVTEQQIRAHCARTLEDFMQPKYVEITKDLPRTENGKVDKRRLVTEFENSTSVRQPSQTRR